MERHITYRKWLYQEIKRTEPSKQCCKKYHTLLIREHAIFPEYYGMKSDKANTTYSYYYHRLFDWDGKKSESLVPILEELSYFEHHHMLSYPVKKQKSEGLVLPMVHCKAKKYMSKLLYIQKNKDAIEREIGSWVAIDKHGDLLFYCHELVFPYSNDDLSNQFQVGFGVYIVNILDAYDMLNKMLKEKD